MLEELKSNLRLFTEIIDDYDENMIEYINEKLRFLIEDCVPMRGYVYIVYVGDRYYKIGMTIDINKRLGQLEEQRIVKVVKANNIRKLEQALHNKFIEKRLTRSQELFKLNDEDILYIHQLEDEWNDGIMELF